MVCIPCIIAPVLLFIWHRFIQPIVLSVWNPWAKKEIRVDAAGDSSSKEKACDTADTATTGGENSCKQDSSLSEATVDEKVSKKTN
uniref:Putative secreted protein n=1 Tax=Amblyomma americanum TaxID=6943 RepID=A0A0C9RVN4_AMBAM